MVCTPAYLWKHTGVVIVERAHVFVPGSSGKAFHVLCVNLSCYYAHEIVRITMSYCIVARSLAFKRTFNAQEGLTKQAAPESPQSLLSSSLYVVTGSDKMRSPMLYSFPPAVFFSYLVDASARCQTV